MNLPQNATEFLDIFIGYLTRRTNNNLTTPLALPTIHVYAFSTADDPVHDVAARSAESLQCPLSSLGTGIVSTADLGIHGVSGPKEMKLVIDALYEQHLVVGHIVRDVSPKKMMVCLSFVLPICVAEAKPKHYGANPSSCCENHDVDNRKRHETTDSSPNKKRKKE